MVAANSVRGDALRHVHPRSSARLGVPVVKEFQAEGRSRTAVLVDTRAGNVLSCMRARLMREDPVEAALSLAAAITDALSTTDRVLELLVAGPQIYRFVSAGRVGYLEEVLDILAAVEPSWKTRLTDWNRFCSTKSARSKASA